MAILISAHEISKTFTSRPLFEGISFSIESGQRIGLIGPNGAGKSTLLRILSGQIGPDSGKISMQKGLRIGYLEQVPKFQDAATVESSVLEGARDAHDWQDLAKAQELMSKLSLSGSSPGVSPDTPISKLSGGWKKRVALARELLREPDLLLLDEPTNHLDVESILWLEDLLAHSGFATLTITHDRLFLQRVANRILELDRRHANGILSVNGDYTHYLETREQLLQAQQLHEEKLRNTLRRETEWLRRGAKARQTKQQARVQKAKDLKDTVDDLSFRNRSASVRLDFSVGEKNPKRLIEAKGISKSYGSDMIIPPLDLLITPKTRLGLLGANGCGKSTLIRLLTKDELPDSGSVTHAEQLKVSYFEQNRESLEQEISVIKTVCPYGDHVDYAGTKVHVRSYLSRFLFSYEQMDLAVRKLSGGEQSRLVLAKLMLKEANLLILDEPTNDLDISTLDVLQEILKEFGGAVILVTHDRYFMDQVARQILAFGVDTRGQREIVPLVGLEQWEDWHDEQVQLQQNLKVQKDQGPTNIPAADDLGTKLSPKKKKLSFKEQRELDQMEENIQKAEKKLADLIQESSDPQNATNAKRLTELTQEMAQVQAEIDRLYARWSELES